MGASPRSASCAGARRRCCQRAYSSFRVGTFSAANASSKTRGAGTLDPPARVGCRGLRPMMSEVSDWSRRDFLKTAGGAAFFSGAASISGLRPLMAAATAPVKIRDIQTMTLTGPRTYVLVKVVADNCHYGIAEAYGLPSIGVKEQIQALKPLLVGKNPLEIDALYTFMGIGGPEL